MHLMDVPFVGHGGVRVLAYVLSRSGYQHNVVLSAQTAFKWNASYYYTNPRPWAKACQAVRAAVRAHSVI